ncbi:MAG: hypothetical protein C3F13_17380 [Anaerolineales bacterium]|nr:MAG: hypothetical protein C3F13_17380 [Anaerolineales bacterium]
MLSYLQYGWSLIRREGLGFAVKRFCQLVSWKVKVFLRYIHIGRSIPPKDRILEIGDLTPTDMHAAPVGSPAGPGDIDIADLAQTPAFRDRLIQLARTIHEQHLPEREALIQEGRQLFSGQKVLFVSPIRVLGGGANLIFLAAQAMRRMGVDAQILNLNVHRNWFEGHYQQPDVPVIFSDIDTIPRISGGFEAVIATSNPTVAWLAPLVGRLPAPTIGYYIQDYEPYFYEPGSHEYQKAADSYSLIPNALRMVTTPWISEQIQRHHHIDSVIVGAHMDTDLFQPQLNLEPAWPARPLRITAMIRPTTPRRNPQRTMAVLQRLSQSHAPQLEFRLFGCDLSDPGFSSLEQDFPWKLAGQLRSSQVACLFNGADIFVDFSDFQAFGLTALEAMAMGLAVIVPSKGGTSIYAEHDQNCLLVDTQDIQACLEALQRLVEDVTLRARLQLNAVSTAARFYPELPALNMLKVLFPSRL